MHQGRSLIQPKKTKVDRKLENLRSMGLSQCYTISNTIRAYTTTKKYHTYVCFSNLQNINIAVTSQQVDYLRRNMKNGEPGWLNLSIKAPRSPPDV